MVATKDKIYKRTETRKGTGEKNYQGKGSQEDNRGWKKATGPYTITFLLLSSPPSSQYPKDEDLYVKTSD